MEAGCDPARFWNITPAEAAREMRGKAMMREHEQRLFGWLAWHIEFLARTKKLPPLRDMVSPRPKRSGERQSPEVALANLKLAFGYPGENPSELGTDR